MKKSTSIFAIVIMLFLALAYILPLWSVQLEAPQYPEGLGMKIWINKLSGDINTINGLNHYIGMKKIKQDSIPELKIMPLFLGILIVLGLVAAFSRRIWMFGVWLVVFAGMGILAGLTFYRWEYDYGHTLDPHAAIKIPGMSYQPPMLGTKQLLNFTVHSYPAVGGILLLLTALVSIAFFIYLLKSPKGVKNLPDHAS